QATRGTEAVEAIDDGQPAILRGGGATDPRSGRLHRQYEQWFVLRGTNRQKAVVAHLTNHARGSKRSRNPRPLEAVGQRVRANNPVSRHARATATRWHQGSKQSRYRET